MLLHSAARVFSAEIYVLQMISILENTLKQCFVIGEGEKFNERLANKRTRFWCFLQIALAAHTSARAGCVSLQRLFSGEKLQKHNFEAVPSVDKFTVCLQETWLIYLSTGCVFQDAKVILFCRYHELDFSQNTQKH